MFNYDVFFKFPLRICPVFTFSLKTVTEVIVIKPVKGGVSPYHCKAKTSSATVKS